jgi:hypothetical protein
MFPLRSCRLLTGFCFFFGGCTTATVAIVATTTTTAETTNGVDNMAQQQQQQQDLYHRALQMGCVSTIPETVPYHIIAKHSNLVLRAMVEENDMSVVQAYSSTGSSDNWVLLPGPTPSAYFLQVQGTMKKMIGTLFFFFFFLFGRELHEFRASISSLSHTHTYNTNYCGLHTTTTTTTTTTNVHHQNKQSPGDRPTLGLLFKFRPIPTFSPTVVISGVSNSSVAVLRPPTVVRIQPCTRSRISKVD